MNKQERQLAYERERKAMNDLAMREFDRERAIEAIHKEHIETIQEQIDGFYMRYAGSEGLTRAEAMKRADQMDVTKFANKAKKAVKEKDFSPETNEWLKTYNLKMKVSRLELLKEELNWELIQMYDKDYQLISESLREEARLELERQAGILGDSAKGASKRIDGIVNSDFYGKNFSAHIWSRTGLYQATQKEVFNSLSRIYTTMDGYRNERNRLMEKMQTSEYETMRLLRTENARIGSQMQVEAYKANEFTHFIYVAEPGACDICGPLDGKIFPVSEAQIGLNLKPLHPNCRCSSHGYIAMERLVDGEWVDEMTGEKVEEPAKESSSAVQEFKPVEPRGDLEEKLQNKSDEWYSELDEREKTGIRAFTDTFYDEMNGLLMDPSFDSIDDDYMYGNIDYLDKALSKFKLEDDIVVYRGVSTKEYEYILENNVFNEFKSTSTYQGTANEFAERAREGGHVVEFKVKKGSEGAYVGNNSDVQDEREFILNRGATYTVEEKDGVLEVTINGYDKKELPYYEYVEDE